MWGRPWPWVWSKRTYWRLQAVNVWWKCMVVGALQVTLRQLSARWRSRHRQRRSEPRDHTGFAGASQSKRLEQCYRHTAVRQSSLRLVLVLARSREMLNYPPILCVWSMPPCSSWMKRAEMKMPNSVKGRMRSCLTSSQIGKVADLDSLNWTVAVMLSW